MAKIAFVSQPRDPVVAGDAQRGSVTTVLWELATRIARRHETLVIAPQAPGQPAEEAHDSLLGIRRVTAWRSLHKALDLGTGILRWRSPYFASSAYFREYGLEVARVLQQYRPDIVHLQNHSHFLPLFRRAVPYARLIMQVHDELHSLLPPERIRSRLQDATAVVTPSDFVTRRLEGRMSYLAGRLHTIGNGVDTATFQPVRRDIAARRDDFRILYVGRLSPEKGVHTLAAAFGQLLGSGVRAELDLVGQVGLLPLSQVQLLARDPQMAALGQFYGRGFWGSLDRQLLRARSGYRRHIDSLIPVSSRDRLRFLGQLPRDAVIDLYQRADVLVIPSLCEEPFGLPVAEGMACGLPCVGSNTGGIPEIIEHERTGLLVERGDTPGLAQALRRLADEPATRGRLGRLGRERAERLFDWSVPAARLEALYQRALHTPAAKSGWCAPPSPRQRPDAPPRHPYILPL